jgi:hypothetical protein
VEKRVAATATITNDPRTMRKMKGAERVNGLEGSEVDAGVAEELVAADEVDEDETEADEDDEAAEEDMRIFGIVLVGFVEVGWAESVGVAVGDGLSVGAPWVTAEVGVTVAVVT